MDAKEFHAQVVKTLATPRTDVAVVDRCYQAIESMPREEVEELAKDLSWLVLGTPGDHRYPWAPLLVECLRHYLLGSGPDPKTRIGFWELSLEHYKGCVGVSFNIHQGSRTVKVTASQHNDCPVEYKTEEEALADIADTFELHARLVRERLKEKEELRKFHEEKGKW